MSKKKKQQNKDQSIAVNRRARRNYEIADSFETGIVLQGTEVKSLRAGQIQFNDAYASVKNGELWLLQTHIEEYLQGNRFNHDPLRPRKLLMHKREILKLHARVARDGYTLIPLKFYFKGSRVKVELGLCRGKKQHDQRQDIAKRDAKREIERAMRKRY